MPKHELDPIIKNQSLTIVDKFSTIFAHFVTADIDERTVLAIDNGKKKLVSFYRLEGEEPNGAPTKLSDIVVKDHFYEGEGSDETANEFSLTLTEFDETSGKTPEIELSRDARYNEESSTKEPLQIELALAKTAILLSETFTPLYRR